MEKFFNHPILGNILITKKLTNRNYRLKVHPEKGVSVSIPYYGTYKTAIDMIDRNIEWILRTRKRQEQQRQERDRLGIQVHLPQTQDERIALAQSAREDLLPRIERLARENGFAHRLPDGNYSYDYQHVALKNNSSNWGSCSSRKNINLNIRLMLVPEHLRDYIILHELCHLRHQNHGPEFHRLLNHLLNGREKEYSREIRFYQW